MSDANKAMIDASGRLIRGATHPYVIADDLYPMVPTQQIGYYQRNVLSYTSCAASDIWSEDWTIIEGFVPDPLAYYQNNTGTFTKSIQMLFQFKFAGSNIDWARVKKLTLAVDLLLDGDAQNGRVTKSINNESLPSGTTVRDSWDTVFTTADSGEHIVEWEINGVEPTSLEVAIMFDGNTCLLDGVSLFALKNGSQIGQDIRIVYNLAT